MIKVVHIAGDRLRMEVRGHELFTDQPVEDGGDDTAPTPTELFVTSLTACVAFYAERFLRRHGFATEGLSVVSDYRWADNPRRVGAIELQVNAPGLAPEKQPAFTRVIEHCTVHNTLLHTPDIRIQVAAGREAAA